MWLWRTMAGVNWECGLRNEKVKGRTGDKRAISGTNRERKMSGFDILREETIWWRRHRNGKNGRGRQGWEEGKGSS